MDQVQGKDPQGCECCGLPLLMCPKARRVALDGRLSSNYPTMRKVVVGSHEAHAVALHFRVVKGKR